MSVALVPVSMGMGFLFTSACANSCQEYMCHFLPFYLQEAACPVQVRRMCFVKR